MDGQEFRKRCRHKDGLSTQFRKQKRNAVVLIKVGWLMHLIQQTLEDINHLPGIKSWLDECNIKHEIGSVILHPSSFESMVTIMLWNEIDETAYYLRWGK